MTAKLSLSWLNVLLVVLLLAAWLGIWAAVERWRSDDDRLTEPREDEVQLREGIPSLQGKLTAAQGELAAVQAKLLDQRVELLTGEATLGALRVAYPRLQALGIFGPGGGVAPGWLSVRPETLQALVQANLDLDAASRLLRALEADQEELFFRRAALEKLAARLQDGWIDAIPAPDGLTACSDQLGEIRKRLVEARIERMKCRLRLEGLVASDPVLANVRPDVAPLLALPSDAIATLASASSRHARAASMTGSLEAAVAGRRKEVDAAAGELIKAQRRAAHKLENDRTDWEFWKHLDILLISLGISLGVLLIAGLVYLSSLGKTLDGPNRALMGWICFGTLVVVDAYQAFQVVGGSLAALALACLAGIWLVLRGDHS